MCSLAENRPLLYSILGSFGLVIVLVTGVMPEFSEQFSVVEFPQPVTIFYLFLDYRALFNKFLFIFNFNSFKRQY